MTRHNYHLPTTRALDRPALVPAYYPRRYSRARPSLRARVERWVVIGGVLGLMAAAALGATALLGVV